jgi:hypothetical protein
MSEVTSSLTSGAVERLRAALDLEAGASEHDMVRRAELLRLGFDTAVALHPDHLRRLRGAVGAEPNSSHDEVVRKVEATAMSLRLLFDNHDRNDRSRWARVIVHADRPHGLAAYESVYATPTRRAAP